MVETEIRGSGNIVREPAIEDGSLDAKRARIRFKRADAGKTADTFGDNGKTGNPRKQRGIPTDKQTTVTISDSRAENSQKVRGRPPKEPQEESEDKAPTRRAVGRPSRRTKPTIEDSFNTAKFLLSAVEVAAVTSMGPSGEMTDWERGLLQAPLQRIILRTPIGVVEKGGIFIDIGFLTLGFGIYFSRVFRGAKLPDWLKKKEVNETQEDTQAPVAAKPHEVVTTIKAGDVDGLAVPIPNAITANMNGNI